MSKFPDMRRFLFSMNILLCSLLFLQFLCWSKKKSLEKSKNNLKCFVEFNKPIDLNQWARRRRQCWFRTMPSLRKNSLDFYLSFTKSWLIAFDWHFEPLVTFLNISSQLSSSSSGGCWIRRNSHRIYIVLLCGSSRRRFFVPDMSFAA